MAAAYRVEDIKSAEFYINLALEFKDMLTINEFIDETKFPIDNFMIEHFWHNLDMDIPIYLSDDLIRWCGYKGKFVDQKSALLKFIKRNEISVLSFSQDEYLEFYEKMETPYVLYLSNYRDPKTISKNATKFTHILITPLNFKRLVMMLKTDLGNIIRDYFLALEILVKYYSKYQTTYQKRKCDILTIENTLLTQNLIEMNAKLDVATDDRAPKTKDSEIRNKFYLLKLNNPACANHYYVIRAQVKNAKKALEKKKEAFPNLTIILEIKYQPNAINLFNLVKEAFRKLRSMIQITGNNVVLTDYTCEKLVEYILNIDEIKKTVNVSRT